MTGRQTTLAMICYAACTALVVTRIATGATDGGSSEQRERSGRGPAPSVPAVVFLRQVVHRLAANDYSAVWPRLDPRQQRLVPRDAYARCESLTPIPGRLEKVDALEVRTERVVVPGSGKPATTSTVVTFRLTFAPRPSQSPVVVHVRAHALRNSGRWSWMLPAARLALHTSGQCGVPPGQEGPAV